jgi:hypothetical protein
VALAPQARLIGFASYLCFCLAIFVMRKREFIEILYSKTAKASQRKKFFNN